MQSPIRKQRFFCQMVIHSFLCIVMVGLFGCSTVKFVQPYDDVLFSNTQDFYTETALFLISSEAKSPANRPDSENPENPGHFAHYQQAYQQLVIKTNALIMRAMVNSIKVNELGRQMQGKVAEMIEQSAPSNCSDPLWSSSQEFRSLTVSNYIDLKCLITNWQVQHQQAPNRTLTNRDWGRRHQSLLQIVIAIQQAESFKQDQQGT